MSTLLLTPSVSFTTADYWTPCPLSQYREVETYFNTAFPVLPWMWHPLLYLVIFSRFQSNVSRAASRAGWTQYIISKPFKVSAAVYIQVVVPIASPKKVSIPTLKGASWKWRIFLNQWAPHSISLRTIEKPQPSRPLSPFWIQSRVAMISNPSVMNTIWYQVIHQPQLWWFDYVRTKHLPVDQCRYNSSNTKPKT